MVFLHITKDNVDDLRVIQKHIQQGDHVFLIIHKTGCPPCMATMPKWLELEKVLGPKYTHSKNIVIADINQEVGVDQLAKFTGEIEGFPTLRYIGKEGKKVEDYENSGVKNPDRSIDSFIEWIESKVVKVESVSPVNEAIKTNKFNHKQVHKRLTYRNNYRPRPSKKRRHRPSKKNRFNRTKKFRR